MKFQGLKQTPVKRREVDRQLKLDHTRLLGIENGTERCMEAIKRIVSLAEHVTCHSSGGSVATLRPCRLTQSG